jgi:uncharacterized membrane protein
MRDVETRPHQGGRWKSPEWVGLGVLAAFTVTAILGYGVFARNPNLIPDSDSARRFYGLSFQLFARIHIVLAGMVLLIPLLRRARLTWVPAFLAVCLVSFLSEFVGTGYGFPFGGYEYTALLGPKLGGRVPAVIPLSWFLMALPSWAMANAVFSGASQRLGRIILGAYLLTAWDLALDPAMSYLTPYWVWKDPGPFYGMPLVNLLGWLGTGMVLMGLMEGFGARRWGPRLPLPWLISYFGVVLFMPVGMIAAAGLWWAVLATLVALALAWGLHVLLRARTSPGFDPSLAQGTVGT